MWTGRELTTAAVLVRVGSIGDFPRRDPDLPDPVAVVGVVEWAWPVLRGVAGLRVLIVLPPS
jgi:hypothetical protein